MSETPDHFINEDVVRRSFANKYEAHPSDVTIKNFDIVAGSNKGDNYACLLKKVTAVFTVRGVEKKDQMMIKCFPSGAYWRQILKQNLMFRTEVTMYTDVVPRLNEIAKKHGMEEISIPKSFYSDSEEGFLSMEDLKEQGYVIEDKSKGLDVAHMKMVLTQLARMHALSYNWIENYFGGLTRFAKDYWTMNEDKWTISDNEQMNNMMEGMFDGVFNMFKLILEKDPSDKDLLDRLDAFASKRKETVEAIHPAKGKFNCIVHNDAWCNNFMFKNDSNGAPLGIKVIDLQLSRRCRPSVDLAYLFGCSLTPTMRANHTQEFLSFYHKELVQNLVTLGYTEDLYPMEQLQEDYKECFCFGFAMSTFHAQIQLVDANAQDNISVDDMTSESASLELFEKYKEFQRKQAETNVPLRTRMRELAVEAKKMNVI